MHEYGRESNNVLHRLNLGYLYHRPGLCGNPDEPGCVHKNPNTALLKSWAALGFWESEKCQGKNDLGELLQTNIFKGKDFPLKTCFCGSLCLAKTALVPQGLPPVQWPTNPGRVWSLFATGTDAGTTLEENVSLPALFLGLEGSMELPAMPKPCP